MGLETADFLLTQRMYHRETIDILLMLLFVVIGTGSIPLGIYELKKGDDTTALLAFILTAAAFTLAANL